MGRPHHPVRRAPFMRVMDNSVAQSLPDLLRFAAHLDETDGTPDRCRRSVFRPDGIQTPGESGQRECPPSASLTGRSSPPDRLPYLLRTDEANRTARMISRLQERGQKRISRIRVRSGCGSRSLWYLSRPRWRILTPLLLIRSCGDSLWLSELKPIVPPGTLFPAGFTDLQAWPRNEDLAPVCCVSGPI